MTRLFVADGPAMEAFGAALARCIGSGALITLHGELGAGKTTLVRGFLRARGHRGAVRSPTYTLVEPYESVGGSVYHFDLYRLGDPEELEFMGVRDYFDSDSVCLVEWPERGEGVLPPPDLRVRIEYAGEGRELSLEPCSHCGEAALACLAGEPAVDFPGKAI